MIYGFMHVATFNHWKDIVQEQIALIKSSGLFDYTQQIYAGVLGQNAAEAIGILEESGIKVFDYNLNLELYEMFTLRHLKAICHLCPDSKVWYIHTKGLSSRGENTTAWRKYMEYFVIMAA